MNTNSQELDTTVMPATRRGILPRLAGLVAGIGVLGLATRQPAAAPAKGKKGGAAKGALIRTQRAQLALNVPNAVGSPVSATLTCPTGSAKERAVMYGGGVSTAGPVSISKSWPLDAETWEAEVMRTAPATLALAIFAINCGYYRK